MTLQEKSLATIELPKILELLAAEAATPPAKELCRQLRPETSLTQCEKMQQETEDASRLISSLMNEGYSATKLATTGGFLRSGNTTLLLGVDDNKFDGAMTVIEKVCKSRKQIATSPSPMAGSTGVYAPYPIEVMVGGATIFVLNVEQFTKI